MKRYQFTVKPYRSAKRPALKWQVVGKDPNGKRTRRFARDDGKPFNKAQADQYAHLKNLELDQHGLEATQLSTFERVVAQRCIAELAPYGLTLQEAVRFAIEREAARKRSCTIETISDQYLDSLIIRKLSHPHILGVRRVLKRLVENFRGKLVSDFTTKNLEEFLNRLGPSWSARSRNQHRTKLTALWAYGEKHGYCSQKTARNIDWIKPVETVVGILLPAEAAALMSVASPKIAAGIAIGLWGGLRVEEICKLDWSQIDLRSKPDPKTGGFGFIRVLPEKAKTGRNRYVTILPNLAAWLRPFHQVRGPVVVPKTSQYFDELRQLDQVKAGIANWPNNALRHSYASYHYAHFNDLGNLVAQMGHAGSQQIFRHYREVVRSDEAEEFWTIAPFSRPDVTKINSFTPDAYPWCRKVGRVIEGDHIDGVKNLAHYFGVDCALLYYWFNHVQDCPPRPDDDRFHISTWREFVARHPEWKSNRYECASLFFVSWYCGDDRRSCERRVYFPTMEEAVTKADAENRTLLGKEVRLKEVRNVIEFTTKLIAAGTFESPPEHRSIEIASTSG
jgi:integrase